MKQIKKHRFIPFFLLIFVCTIFFSCTKMDETYKDFIKDGEIIYTGKVDSLTALPGKNRVQLKWYLVSDPKITKNVVYWNNKKDSLVMDVQKTANTDTIVSFIDNLNEGVYTFSVFTHDNFGHSSVKAEVIGVSYGDNYANTLSNRPLSSALLDVTTTSPTYKSAILKWFGVSAQAVIMEIIYTDNTNALKTVTLVPVIDPNYPNRAKALPVITYLPNYKKGASFSYRTGFKPVDNCIDYFYTDYAVEQF